MLPRSARLRKRRDFSAVFSRARSGAARTSVHSSEYLSVHVRRSPRDAGTEVDAHGARPVRFGFVVSKKVSKRAHDRNRLKRRLSEAVRTAIDIASGRRGDCVVVVRKPALELGFHALAQELSALLGRSGMIADMSEDDRLPGR